MRQSSLVASLAVVVLFACRAEAQNVRPLTADDLIQLSPSARQSIARLGDSVRAVGLPDQPLYAKAAEGMLKHASEARILAVVQTLASELAVARRSLGSGVDDAELVAAASALHVGATPAMLRRLAVAREAAGQSTGSLATPLVAFTDLLVRRVPPTAATAAIDSLVTRRAPSADFAALRAAVERDIEAGRSPEASVMARTQTLLHNIDSRRP